MILFLLEPTIEPRLTFRNGATIFKKSRIVLESLAIVIIAIIIIVIIVREGVKNPRHRNFPLGGYPTPGASTDENFPKS